MEAQGRSDSTVRAERLQSARCYSRESLFVGNPLSRVLSARLRRVVCDNFGSPELQAPRLAADGGRGAPQVSTDLRIHEASGSQSLRLKMNTTGRAAVRIWSPLGVQVCAPQSWSQCSAKCRIRLKGFWLMAKEIGVVAECTDVQLSTAEVECPF